MKNLKTFGFSFSILAILILTGLALYATKRADQLERENTVLRLQLNECNQYYQVALEELHK